MPYEISNRDDYEALLRALAVKFAAEDKVPVSTSHYNRARRELWPHLSQSLQGELVMR